MDATFSTNGLTYWRRMAPDMPPAPPPRLCGRARCTDAAGLHVNIQSTLLPYILRSNWRACSLAASHGFACVDSFAELMGADTDTNQDGKPDSEGLAFDPSESEDDYVQRLRVRLRSTIRDANSHPLASGHVADYILSDDTHPTFAHGTIRRGSISRGAPDFSDRRKVQDRCRRLDHGP